MFNQANALYRGGEAANATGASAIKGAKAYYEATAKAKKGILTNEEADFSQVGVKAYEEEGKWYFEYELGAPVTMFYARYYISSCGIYQFGRRGKLPRLQPRQEDDSRRQQLVTRRLHVGKMG